MIRNYLTNDLCKAHDTFPVVSSKRYPIIDAYHQRGLTYDKLYKWSCGESQPTSHTNRRLGVGSDTTPQLEEKWLAFLEKENVSYREKNIFLMLN